jgi:hypothetical protein
MKNFILFSVVLLIAACQKSELPHPPQNVVNEKNRFRMEGIANAPAPIAGYTLYTIATGAHYCDKSTLKSVSTSEMKFYAQFDASAIYTSVTPVNQYDINKLWGFSEGINNQYNSCRIGWGYNDGNVAGVNLIGTPALRLYAYSYALGVRYSKEIAVVPLNIPVYCSIKLSGNLYTCTVQYTENNVVKTYSATVNRGATATKASGYQQYPYFGGDEVAPHPIYINIKPA